jgi:hypothetical protein
VHIAFVHLIPTESVQTSHEKVKKRAFLLLRKWAGEFERDERLGLVEDAYQSLLSKGRNLLS